MTDLNMIEIASCVMYAVGNALSEKCGINVDQMPKMEKVMQVHAQILMKTKDVFGAVIPGRWADPPAPAIQTRNPSSASFSDSKFIFSDVL